MLIVMFNVSQLKFHMVQEFDEAYVFKNKNYFKGLSFWDSFLGVQVFLSFFYTMPMVPT